MHGEWKPAWVHGIFGYAKGCMFVWKADFTRWWLYHLLVNDELVLGHPRDFRTRREAIAACEEHYNRVAGPPAAGA